MIIALCTKWEAGRGISEERTQDRDTKIRRVR